MKNPAIKISLIYLFIGIVWIISSDAIAYKKRDYQTIKGVSYVLVTGLLLYFLVNRNEKKNKILLNNYSENEKKLNHVFDEKKKIIQQLNVSNEKLENLINNLDGIIWEANPSNYKFTYVSSQCEKLLGYSAEKWLNENDFWQNIIHPDDRKKAIEFCHTETLKNRNHQFEYRVIKANGEICWIRDLVIIHLVNGKAEKLSGLMLDISDIKRAELELQKNEALFRALIENSSEMKTMFDENGNVLYESPSIQKTMGYSIKAQSLENLNKLIHPEDIQKIISAFTSVLQNKDKEINIQIRQKNANNNWLVLEGCITNLLNVEGINAVVCNFNNVSDRFIVEQKIKKSEEQFRLMFENSIDGLLLTKLNGDIISSNKVFSNLLGYSLSELKNKNRFDITNKNDPRLFEVIEIRNKTGEFKGNFDFKKKDGEKIQTEISSTIFSDEENNQLVLTSIRDISEKIKREKEKNLTQEITKAFPNNIGLNDILQERLLKLISFFNIEMAEIWFHVPHNNSFILSSCAFKEKEKEIIYRANEERNLPINKGVPALVYCSNKTMVINDVKNHNEFIRKKLYDKLNLNYLIAIPLSVANEVIGVLVFAQNQKPSNEEDIVNFAETIKEQLATEIKRKITEEEFNHILNYSPDIICTIDKDGSFININKTCQSILGYQDKELIGKKLNDFVYYQDTKKTYGIVQKIMASNTTFNFENRFQCKDGTIKPLLWSAVWSGELNKMFCTAKDATQIKLAQTEIYKRQHLLDNILNNMDEGVVLCDTSQNILVYNAKIQSMLNIKDNDSNKILVKINSLFYNDKSLVPIDETPINRAIRGFSATNEEYLIETFNSNLSYISVTATPLHDENKKIYAGMIVIQDITLKKQKENLLQIEKKILKMNLDDKISFQNICNHFLIKIEELFQGAICSLMLTNDKETYLESFATPSLPEKFKDLTRIIKIESNGASCAEAAFLKQSVIVADVTSKSNWFEFNKIAEEYQISSCWAYPILSTEKKVIATLSFYHKNCKSPNELEKDFIEQIIKTLSQLIINKKTEKKLIESNEQYQAVLKATSDKVWDWDINENKLSWNENNTTHTSSQTIESYIKTILIKDRQRVKQSLIQTMQLKEQVWTEEYEIEGDNKTQQYVLNRGCLIYNEKNEPIRMIGAVSDLTQRKQLELDIIKYAERLNEILESITDAFFAFDNAWKFTYVNKEAEKYLAVNKEKAIGLNFWKILPELKKTLLENKFKLALKSGVSQHFEFYFELLNSWFEFSVYPSTHGISVYFKNVTYKKETENIIKESVERYDLISRATNDIIWEYDLKTNKTIYSTGLKTKFGYDNIKFNSQEWREKIHPEDVDLVTLAINSLLLSNRQKTSVYEYRFLNSENEYVYILDRVFADRDEKGNLKRIVGAMQDITKRKKDELLLQELNDSLSKRAKELAFSNSELEQFAYTASHDLQEPLRMVASFLQLLKKKYQGKLDETADQYISFAVDGAERMKMLILDILEYSKVDNTAGSVEKINMEELIQNLKNIFINEIEQNNVKINSVALPTIKGFKTLIMQLLQNLISNAIKYKSNRDVIINIDYTENDAYWIFSFEDNCIGIENNKLVEIFIAFKRLHNRSNLKGTGIGLAICKKIVEKHKGEIWAESIVNKGSTFFFSISKQLQ